MSWKHVFAALSPAGPRARLSVLIYHRVLREKDPLLPYEPDACEFEQRMQWLRRWFNVLPLREAVRRMRDRSLPARALCVTFDDGYADNLEVALPVLRRHEIPATFFIATAFLDGGRMFNDTVIEAIRRTPATSIDLRDLDLGTFALHSIVDRKHAINAILPRLKHLDPTIREAQVSDIARRSKARLPSDLMLTVDQLRTLHIQGGSVGAHTKSHPILASVDAATAKREIDEGRDELERIVGERVELFAYPNGRPGHDYRSEHVQLVHQAGFRAAFSTAPGAARADVDCLQLPRFTPWDSTPAAFALRLARNLRRPSVTVQTA
jgi:peptidoglycan/xylan/chitin deacetylase (PgdA/CDA1 family)